MSEYYIKEIENNDTQAMVAIDALLLQEGIKRDQNLDVTCAIFDDNHKVIATGSCFGNTLRCFAVDHAHQGEGLVNKLLTHLIQLQMDRGNSHLFLYTKISTAPFFKDLGFTEIARVDDSLVFMENRANGFKRYLARLEKRKTNSKRTGAIVMNANPFTLGHQYLVEKASSECDTLHLFIVSEDSSIIPFTVRRQLVKDGLRHIDNIKFHDSGPYIISNATFPSYFLKDEISVMENHAKLDLQVFCKIADILDINIRFVGEEPSSQVTALYNKVMAERLPEHGIECKIIPRKTIEHDSSEEIISASTARYALQQGDFAYFAKMVPESTWHFFQSEEAKDIITNIQNSKNVIHH